MGCFVRGSKNSMGCFVLGDKNCMGCFVRGGKLMRDVLSGVAKNGMGCFVPGCFVLHSINSDTQTNHNSVQAQYTHLTSFVMRCLFRNDNPFLSYYQICHFMGRCSDYTNSFV